MMLLIDPPSGWKYGFPKEYDNPDNLPVDEWLLLNGYPKKEIDYWLKSDHFGYVPCRWIGTKEEIEDVKIDRTS